MRKRSAAILLVTSLALAPNLASAQDTIPHAHQAMSQDVQLPAACTAGAHAPVAAAPMNHPMDAAHTALMAGMDEMHGQMMTGMMAENVDVAFVCGMIPHHQGAIAMAKAELEHGQDAWTKQTAQKIIDAQQAEITEMLAWLANRSPAS